VGNALALSIMSARISAIDALDPWNDGKDRSLAPARTGGVGPDGGWPCAEPSVALAAPSGRADTPFVVTARIDRLATASNGKQRAVAEIEVETAMITLAQADRLIDAILERGAELECRPLSVIVVEPGCKVKAFKKEDGSSMIRFEMAYGKAYAALAMGRSSKLVKVRAEEKPIFMRYLLSASGDQIFPEGGGLQIRDAQGEVIGAVGVTGDSEERDEELAAYGIRAIGLKTDDDCEGMGRRAGIRLTDK
jgi:uncharacterized protein GlcG (DUF336 family)